MPQRALRILISAGPTREPIDPVRFISNYSTGYMGAQLAAEALARGHKVTVVSGPVDEPLPPRARTIRVDAAAEMDAQMRRQAARADVVVMAAAVSDFRPARPRASKLPRRSALTLRLEATPDIVGRLPRRRRQLRVGFALESGRVVDRAKRKLREKRLDLLLAQRLDARQARSPERSRGTQRLNGAARPGNRARRAGGAPFGRRQVQAWLIAGDGAATELGRLTKARVARVLLDKVEQLWYGQRRPTQATHAQIR